MSSTICIGSEAAVYSALIMIPDISRFKEQMDDSDLVAVSGWDK
jgi:hypothetical protein